MTINNSKKIVRYTHLAVILLHVLSSTSDRLYHRMSLERNYFLLFVLPLYKVATQQEAVDSSSLMEAQSVYLLSPLRYRLVLFFSQMPGMEIINTQKQKQISSISWHGQLPKGSLFFFPFFFSGKFPNSPSL